LILYDNVDSRVHTRIGHFDALLSMVTFDEILALAFIECCPFFRIYGSVTIVTFHGFCSNQDTVFQLTFGISRGAFFAAAAGCGC